MNTSKHSAIIPGQDADEFFRLLLDELDANPPGIIKDPLFLVKDLKDNLVFGDNREIERLVSDHQRRIFEIQVALGQENSLSVASLTEVAAKFNTEQLLQAQKMQAVGQLAGGIAHDFGNVLTAIIGYSDLLLANHHPSDPSFEDIMQIKQNANRAAGLVRQLLAFSRRQMLRPQTLRLNDVLSELQMLLSRLVASVIDSVAFF